MKRILFVLVVAGGLAIVSAPKANALNPPYCGKSYAMLMTGADRTMIQQDGTATQPGALTHAVGVGVISFGNGVGCAPITGELIYNAGDLQGPPAAGMFFGPNHCYDNVSLTATGVPCFDGANHFTAASVTNPGPFGNGSSKLVFNAGYNWINTCAPCPGSVTFAFTLQNSLASTVVMGTSIAAPDAPILSLTMEKIATPCATTFGAAPYLGETAVGCQSWGANGSDVFATPQPHPPAIAGGAGSAIGQTVVFPAADALVAPAGGSISFNINDNIGTPGNNNDCAFDIWPGQSCDGTSNPTNPIPTCVYGPSSPSQYADCTSNSIASISIGAIGSSCSNTATAGFGFANSSVQWGPTDTSSYLTTTGLLSTALFVPPGNMSTCTTYYAAPAGSVSNLLVPAAGWNNAPDNGVTPITPLTGYIKMRNSSPATCKVTATLTGVVADAFCTIHVNGGSSATAFLPGDNAPLPPGPIVFTVDCTCTGEDLPNGGNNNLNATLTLSSPNCPLLGGNPNITHANIVCQN